MRIGRSFPALVVALFGMVSSGCVLGPRIWVEDHEERDVPTEAERLDVATHNGAIDLTGVADTGTLHISAQKKAGAGTRAEAEKCLEAVEVVERVSARTHHLEWRWRGARHVGCQARVSFEIRLPQGMRVRARTHNGAVSARGLAAVADLESHNGAIEVRGHSGDLFAETHNGAITAQAVAHEVRVKTQNGRIDLDLRGSGAVGGEITSHNGGVQVDLGREASAKVRCSTHNGRIRAEALTDVRRESKRRLEGRIGQGEGRLRVSTHNGSITLR